MATNKYLLAVITLTVLTCPLWGRRLPFEHSGVRRSEGPIESTDNPEYSSALLRHALGQLTEATVIYSFTMLENFPRAFQLNDSILEQNVHEIVETKLKSAEIPITTIQDWSKSRATCPVIKVSIELSKPEDASDNQHRLATTGICLFEQVTLEKDPNVIFHAVVWEKSVSDFVSLTKNTLVTEDRSVIERRVGYLTDDFIKLYQDAKGYKETLEKFDEGIITGTVVIGKRAGPLMAGDDGRYYVPTNLSKDFCKSGLRVKIRFRELPPPEIVAAIWPPLFQDGDISIMIVEIEELPGKPKDK